MRRNRYLLKANGFFQSLGVVAILLFIPAQACACSLLPFAFDPFPALYPVMITVAGSGILVFRILKNYPKSTNDKKVRPAIAAIGAIAISLAIGFIIYLLWPGYGPKVGCPDGFQRTRTCTCRSADGKSKQPEAMGITINPTRRLNDLKIIIQNQVAPLSAYCTKGLIRLSGLHSFCLNVSYNR